MKRLALVLVGITWLAACGTDATQSGVGPIAADGPARGAVEAPAAAAPIEPAAQVGAAAPAEERGGAGDAKTGAPVDIAAQVGADAASVRIAFRSAATDVTVKVWGADGLVVKSDATPIAGRAFAQGEAVDLAVSFAAPAAGSSLAVSVGGQFGTRRLTRVQSFAVGAAPAAPSAPGELRTDGAGRPVRVLKPQ
jgi:hypothetical protein